MADKIWGVIDGDDEIWALFASQEAAEAYGAACAVSEDAAWSGSEHDDWIDSIQVAAFTLFDDASAVPPGYRLLDELMDE